MRKRFIIHNSQFSIQKGFTIVELLIYMGLLMVLIVVFTEIFASVTDSQLSSKNTSHVADDGRFIFSRFIYDVERAENVIEPTTAGSPSSTLILQIDGDNYMYSLNNGILQLDEPSGIHDLNGYGTTISDLSFTKVGTSSANTSVRINFTITGVIMNEGLIDEQIFQTAARLR